MEIGITNRKGRKTSRPPPFEEGATNQWAEEIGSYEVTVPTFERLNQLKIFTCIWYEPQDMQLYARFSHNMVDASACEERH
jgi:hypothetical protein